MQVELPAANPADFSEVEKAAIEQQVERLLQNPYFSHSRRFPMFLRFVVRHTLAGQADAVKERTLGIEIFGRNADYDTSSDPIVRVTAAEIRKRIAQYYQEPGHDVEIRVSLPAGSYVPHFQWPQTLQIVPTERLAERRAPAELVVAAPEVPRRWKHRSMGYAGLLLLVAVSVAGALWWRPLERSGFDQFWEPILNSGDPVLFCIADQNEYTAIALRDADPADHS
jgi:hypothetical protein